MNLIKFDKQLKKAHLSIEEKSYYSLSHASEIEKEKVPLLIGKDQILKKAFHQLEHFSWSEQALRSYKAEEKRKKTINP